MEMSPARKILVIDDDPVIRSLVREVLHLEHPDVEVDEAGDGDEAYRELRADRPGIALLYLGLPVMNRLEVARRWRKEDPKRSTVLIGFPASSKPNRFEGLTDGEVVKPFDLDDL